MRAKFTRDGIVQVLERAGIRVLEPRGRFAPLPQGRVVSVEPVCRTETHMRRTLLGNVRYEERRVLGYAIEYLGRGSAVDTLALAFSYLVDAGYSVALQNNPQRLEVLLPEAEQKLVFGIKVR